MDSNHRTQREQIYSLPCLATSLILHTITYFPSIKRKIKWWLGTESNRRHEDFQSSALPTELPSLTLKKNGGADGIRTRGLLRDRQACWATTPQLQVDPVIKPNKYLWWRMTGSNRRPSACKADALPAELILQMLR